MRRGFTLIEIAVVLVIIALIISGVVVSRSMIRSAEIREAMSEYSRYAQAIGEFKDKYRALPGDMINAQSYWGINSNCPAGDTGVRKRETCNGNGNGMIGASDGGGTVNPDGEEWFMAWQHLANAGLIEGLYSGAAGSNGDVTADLDINVPASKIKGAGWTLMYYTQSGNTVSLWGSDSGYGSYGHIFFLGAPKFNINDPTVYPAMTPAEAFEIDTKMDDGKPSTGKIRSMRKGNTMTPNCLAADSDPATDGYFLTYTLNACALLFILNI
jgi:prepilin-type N-terminal cleavage/methylation domain-containing protein